MDNKLASRKKKCGGCDALTIADDKITWICAEDGMLIREVPDCDFWHEETKGGEIMDELLARAKERCADCVCLIEGITTGELWCDQADAPIEKVTDCHEWRDSNVGRI